MTVFETECRERVGQLRTAFMELYDSVGADPASPQEVARRFRVNKTLAWNVARLLQASDALAAVHHVPGASSLEKVIQATARNGADPQIVARARKAARDFKQMIEAHAGDRPTLDLIIDSTGRGDASTLELSRKLAFRGNSGLYGVQAQTRVACHFIAPNPGNPRQLDIAAVGGYVGFRRLRHDVRWPIFMLRSWSQREDAIVGPDWTPLEPSEEAGNGFPVMRSFTRGNAPRINLVDTPEGRNYVLGDGPVGNEGAFDCFWGESMRAAVSRYARAPGETGEFGAAITAPTETLISDIIVHRALDFALEPEMFVFGQIFAQGQQTGDANDPTLLPIRQSTIELPGMPPAVSTALVPQYPQIVRQVYQHMGWDPREFKGIRLQMEYPPLGANVILRFALPIADDHA